MIIATIIRGGHLAETDQTDIQGGRAIYYFQGREQADIQCLFQHSTETQIHSNLGDQSLIDQAGQIPPPPSSDAQKT